MYFTSVLEVSHIDGASLEPAPGVFAFSLRFRGDVKGTFGLSIAAPIARTLASNFLGEDEESLADGEIAEVIGELCNMLCGSVVSRIGGARKYTLTHPVALHPNMPSPHALVSCLETDIGTIKTWVAVEAPYIPAESQPAPVLQETH
jgi:CheY-specific phosphatase CheX